MNITDITILLICFIPSIIIALPHILQFQIAEYLPYRMVAMIRDSGLLRVVLPLKFQLPAKSPRNLLIFGFLILFQLLLSIELYFLSVINVNTFVYLLILYYLSAKLAVVLGVALTSPLSYLSRLRKVLIAKRELNRSEVKLISITGSYGKSTVKDILHRILSSQYRTGKSRKNRNTLVGLAIELGAQLDPSMKYFVAEMGAYKVGDIKKMCRTFKPDFTVLTGIGNQHLSLFGSQQKIVKAKSEIINFADSSLSLVNVDSENLDLINRFAKKKFISYGIDNKDAQARVTKIIEKDGGNSFVLKYKGKSETYETKLKGKHSILNLIPPIIIARHLKVEYKNVFEIVKELEPILGKLSLHEGFNGMRTVNDGYNSNLHGFLSAIEVLRTSPQQIKYLSTLGVFELGKDKKTSYEKILNALKGSNIRLLTTDPLFASLGIYESVSVFVDSKDIGNRIKEVANAECVLLLEGRHSVEFTNAIGLSAVY